MSYNVRSFIGYIVGMCGINGFVKKGVSKRDAIDFLKRMNKSIKHRGPDDEGFFFDESTGVGLGHVRLSILDLSEAGRQPMWYNKNLGAFNEKFKVHGSKDLAIVFNGEIYNYLDLKKELEVKGYNFSTKTDTEIILASYQEYGEDCVQKFNGMWSFVIYDKKNKKLFSSRDRLGKKPFYYYFDGEKFIFSSEIKGILEHRELDINKKENIDKEAVDFYFVTGFIPSPWTIYRNIRKLEAGNNMVLRLDNFSLNKYSYYEIPELNTIDDKKYLIEEGKKLLEDSVRIRMITSDVPVGAFLSGGLDSSSVVAEMTRFCEKSKLHTFSVGFEGRYDESEYINVVKNNFGTNHHHSYFRQDDFEKLLDEIYYFYDEPFADYSNFPTTFVSKLAKEFVTVSLSGDGGDEIFGGYAMHRIGAQINMVYKAPRICRKFLYFVIPKTSNNLSILSKLKEAFRISLLPKRDFYANVGGSSIYKPEVYKRWASEKLGIILEKNKGNFVQSLIDFDLLYNTLADNFLVKVDRASMSQSLEVRSPFLDHRWIEFSRKVPVERKVDWKRTKILMRDIIKGIVPDKIVNRGKKGFEPPIKDRILEKKYTVEIEEGLEELHNTGIINKNWFKFYKEKVLANNNSIFNVCKIRLFLFMKWYRKWIKQV